MGTSQWLREHASDYATREELVDACIKATGHRRQIVSNAFYDIQKGQTPIKFGGTPTIPQMGCEKLKGLSESQIREKHDLRFILEKMLSALERGQYIPDADFIKQDGIKSHVGYRQILDGGEYKRYKGKAGGVTYWSHPESIQKMKNEGILS